MKTFKARGKTPNGEWRYGQLLVVHGNAHILEDGDMCEDGHHITQDSDRPTWVEENTVGYFTGRLDDDGKEIYEGDILDVRIQKDRYGKEEHRRRVAVWCDSAIGFNFVDWRSKAIVADSVGAYAGKVTYHVIGNIHDNPYLVEEKVDLMVGDQFYRPDCCDTVVEVRKDGIIGSDSLRGLIPFSQVGRIELTEELLKKHGFKVDHNVRWEELNGFDGRVTVKSNTNFLNTGNKFFVRIINEDMDTVMTCELTYLHQFQQVLRMYGLSFKIDL